MEPFDQKAGEVRRVERAEERGVEEERNKAG